MMPWTRAGECNNCGYCCQFYQRAEIKVTKAPGEVWEPRYFELRGMVKTGHEEGVIAAHIWAPCREHDKDAKRCGIYDHRPRACQEFPKRPEQVLGTPCSYWFERLGDDGRMKRLGGLASPYPSGPADAHATL